ncbi:hypothetical protein CHUAL_000804 [Chamberlinius hualienensis]
MTTSPPSHRLVDYFVICGLDLNSGLEPDLLSGDNLHCTPLERPYKSKVLCHFPENVPWNPFDANAVGMLCLPKGLQFRTQKQSLEPRYHSFIVTKEDGTRTHGFAYTYFEEVLSRPICVAMQTLQAMHKAELSHRHSRTLKAGGHDLYGAGTRSLPRSFRLTSAEHCQHITQSNNLNIYYELLTDKLYVTKCVCLIGQFSFLYACRSFLNYLYKTIMSNEPPQLHLESYIRNILYEVSVPPRGCSASLSCFGHQVIYQRPADGELPLFEYSLRDVLLLLGLENLVNVFTCALLENQILLYSHDYHRLMLVAESVSVLLFPFVWQHVYVPILPASLLHFLDAPVPFVMGLQWDSSCRSQPPVTGEANLCSVDIDNGTVELPEDLPTFPHRSELLQELSEQVAIRGIPLQRKQSIIQSERLVGTQHTKYRRKKMSWVTVGYDSDSSSRTDQHCFPTNVHRNRQDILQHSKAVQRVTEIAKRTGVLKVDDEQSQNKGFEGNNNVQTQLLDQLHINDNASYKNDLLFNNAIREIFLNRFTHLFISYEHFVIQPNQDMEQWLCFRETMHNFDKAAFLSDQPEPHLPFLSRFIETQMFVSFIDNAILSQWELPDPNLAIFDRRIKILRDTYGESLVRTPSYECCTTIAASEEALEKRLTTIEFIGPVPKPCELPSNPKNTYKRGFIPYLDLGTLNKQPPLNKHQRRGLNHAKRKEFAEKFLQESRNKNARPPVLSEMSPALIAQTNWNYVETLLRECKTKTKRMLVEKMGVEAVELGHGELSLNGVEENTLIASLCDLLERVWSHGLQTKQGKSALWSHLLRFQKAEEAKTHKGADSKLLMVPVCSVRTPTTSIPDLLLSVRAGALGTVAAHLANFDIASAVTEMDATFRRGLGDSQESMKTKKDEGVHHPSLKPLPVSLTFDMRNVQAMDEIKTDIGYARAWIRISLEKKLLSKHLKTLLADSEILRSMYKRYAFLRCEDEKEQFLYHLLSLNAVDYYCFSNTFTSTIVTYRTIICPSRKSGAATTSANVWISLSGSLGESGIIPIPRSSLELVFRHQNFGILTTLRIGHDNSGLSPKWMIEHVIVRNEVTSHTYKFPCGRWLGKGVDDGSTERLLVGELVPLTADNEDLMETCRTPPRCRSPNIPRKLNRSRLTAVEIQQILADAVNSIIKHYYKPEKERGSLTILLCGEMGLVACLEQVFLYGFKSTRLFGRHLYLWDYFVKVQSYFESVVNSESSSAVFESSGDEKQMEVIRSYCKLVSEVNQSSHTVGKDGRFQLFICLATRDHVLHRIPLQLASTPVTTQMYEEYSFLREPTLITFLIQITESLEDFPFHLEASLTQAISPRAK